MKSRQNRGLGRQLYFFRDEQGLEVDFVTIGKGGSLHLIEVKWAKTIRPEDARSVLRLRAAAKRRRVEATIVHPVARASANLRTVAPGVSALGVEEFLRGL